MSGRALTHGLSTTRPKAGIGLERIDHFQEVFATNDSFELEARAFVACPYDVRFDPADHREANDDAFTAAEAVVALGHEALCRNIDDTDMYVTALAMFADHYVIDGMPRCVAQVGYR
jgi:hypothetical protein